MFPTPPLLYLLYTAPPAFLAGRHLQPLKDVHTTAWTYLINVIIIIPYIHIIGVVHIICEAHDRVNIPAHYWCRPCRVHYWCRPCSVHYLCSQYRAIIYRQMRVVQTQGLVSPSLTVFTNHHRTPLAVYTNYFIQISQMMNLNNLELTIRFMHFT